jgi:hypothetical protein
MALPACMIEECPNGATFTGTFFETGTSVTVCGEHFVDFAAGTLEAMTGIPVTMLIALPPETFATPESVAEGNETLPPTTPDESSEAGTESDLEEEPTVATNDDEQPHEPDDEPVVHDLSRELIADHLAAKRDAINDAEFLTPPQQL